MSEVHESRLARRVSDAAGDLVKRSRTVAPVDVFVRLGWLRTATVDEWRQGRHDHLHAAMTVRPDKVAAALRALRAWAEANGLEPAETPYPAATRDHRELRFTAGGGVAAERAHRTHWLSPDLTPAQRERLAARQAKAPDITVLMPPGDWTCDGCHSPGGLQVVEDGAPLCLDCADLGHLVFLPSGNAALSRRAKKESGLSAVVVQHNRRRKRYERRGVLVEEAALERAEEQCLADEDLRARRRERDRERRAVEDEGFQARMADAITRLFPGCPDGRAEEIARHAGLRGSGRVGRTAAGRDLDDSAVPLAVIASIRHLDTGYDALLMSGVPRRVARDRIRADVDAVLAAWRRRP
ncbi:DUF2293 domain-containing protein [Actinomadura opuntiae]|uniref:DUF2293 domain-containing protein n=1 Tax=Actinomadura sp. OS1-43 TaxID=604315 RepID=UPI00255B08D2|nr:DUF2293 domain-containing protein [Actinomadura sp. OS1-43]MDL4821188.1 DUF2293 domain-containing protein [Actinomadura sp. OS1-43]